MISQLRRSLLGLLYFSLLSTTVSSCASTNRARTPTTSTPNSVANTQPEKAAVNSIPVIHVFVALADNVNQGIVPVSASLGNGDNAASNLYWGAAFGIRTFFSKNKDWQLISVTSNPNASILERCIFKHRHTSSLLVADAYQGKEISQATGYGNQATFSLSATLSAGDTLDFQVGYGGNQTYNSDSTGLVGFKSWDQVLEYMEKQRTPPAWWEVTWGESPSPHERGRQKFEELVGQKHAS